jgi:carbamoyl-phosphate synthase small subunit
MLWKLIVWNDILDEKIKNPNIRCLCSEVSRKEIQIYWKWKKKICLVDMWVKNNIIRSLLSYDTQVTVVPNNYPFMDWSIEFDGLFISNWPWNPEKNKETITELKKAIKADKNIFWICLWNQLIALASWAKTYKLKYGHRWQNQPCKDLETWKCIITSQNHWYAIDNSSLPRTIEAWFKNINDDTNEWIKYKNKNIRSVQFHPESDPGPNDSDYLFENFVNSL